MTDHLKPKEAPAAPTYPDDQPEPGYSNDLAVTNPDAATPGEPRTTDGRRPEHPAHLPGHGGGLPHAEHPIADTPGPKR
jgi:hypothetical protein